MMQSTASNYQLRQADIAEDRADILRLWQASLNHPHASGKYDWLYSQQSPNGEGVIFLLVANDSQATVGVSCLAKRIFCWGQQRLVAGNLADFAVDARHRTLGPALSLSQKTITEGKTQLDFIYGFPNRKAQPVVLRAGCEKFASFVRYALVINPREHLAHRLPGMLVGLVSGLASIFLRLHNFCLRLGSPGWRLQELNDFDQRFDGLFDKAKTNNLLMTERTAEQLRWRHLQDREITNKKILALTQPGGELAGYVVCHMDDSQLMIIDDLLAQDNHKSLRCLLHYFEQYARRQACRSISLYFMGSCAVQNTLKTAWYRQREERMVVAAGGERHNLPLENPDHWYLTASDEDG